MVHNDVRLECVPTTLRLSLVQNASLAMEYRLHLYLYSLNSNGNEVKIRFQFHRKQRRKNSTIMKEQEY